MHAVNPAGALDSWVPAGTTIWVPAILILIGLAGIVVPVLPGLLIVLGGVLLWAYQSGTPVSWWVFVVCAALYVGGLGLQYAVPGRRLRRQGVGTRTLLLALVLGIVGAIVIPVVGGPPAFVLGIYLVEHARTRAASLAWASTRAALRAVLTSIGIELLAGLCITAIWVVAVLLTT